MWITVITQVILSLKAQTRLGILLQHFLEDSGILGSINYLVPSITASDHHHGTTTTMFEWSVRFTTDVTEPSKKFNFCLVTPQNIFPKVLRIIKVFLGKSETNLLFILVSFGTPMDAYFTLTDRFTQLIHDLTSGG